MARRPILAGALVVAASLAAAGGPPVPADPSFVADVTRPLPGARRFVLLASGGIAGWHEPCG